eukprot:TRINITY_DN6103_c0_g1_i2.p1 TRINITY_DN6103_c0_g1~~TRINITY_DN6103_c0_g1_i2.p1  ORF type:complete len:942 (+),score=237.40 TRINITY_DN6103_c0_g1_i2:384-3209(+)
MTYSHFYTEMQDDIDPSGWNTRFQRVFHKGFDGLEEQYEQASTLVQLVEQFMQVAEHVVRTIVNERNLPAEDKTIKPIDAGGIAGGQKFLYDGIFFKYNLDTVGMYAGDEFAMKAAAHEFRSLMDIAMLFLGLSFPLMSIVDYRGFRVTAIAQLPISAKTIVYGSANGGKTVHADIPAVNALMRMLGKKLNLSAHDIAMEDGGVVSITGPGDIEVHVGEDKRVYVLDTARLMPPQVPEKSSDVWYKLFRHEFVRSLSSPLCSDAFTAWGRLDIRKHCGDVRAAYNVYLTQTLPAATADIDYLIANASPHERLISNIHRFGINIRHLGRVRSHSEQPLTKRYLLLELCTRAMKNVLRQHMRDNAHQDLRESFVALSQCITAVLCPHDVDDAVRWNAMMRSEVQKRFDCAFDATEQSADFDLRTTLTFSEVATRVLEKCGIQLTAPALQRLTFTQQWPYGAQLALSAQDIETITPLVAHPSFIFSMQAAVHMHHAFQLQPSDPRFDEAYERMHGAYFRATTVNSHDCEAWSNWALAYTQHAKAVSATDPVAADGFYQAALVRYNIARALKPQHMMVLLNFSTTLFQMAQHRQQHEPLSVDWSLSDEFVMLGVHNAKEPSELLKLSDSILVYAQRLDPRYSRLWTEMASRKQAEAALCTDGPTKVSLMKDAIKQFHAGADALEVYPREKSQLLLQLGSAEFDMGITQERMCADTAAAKQCYGDAYNSFLLSAKYDETNASAYKFQGNASFREAGVTMQQNAPEAVQLCLHAAAAYRQCLALDPSDAQCAPYALAALQLGNQLADGKNVDLLLHFQQMCEVMLMTQPQQQAQYLPMYMQVLVMLGVAAMSEGSLAPSDDERAREMLSLAAQAFQRVEQFQPNSQAYNLACLHSIQQNSKQCRVYLQRAIDAQTVPALQHVMQDADMVFARAQDWFEELKAKLPSE